MSQTNSQYYTAQRSVIGSLLLDARHVAGMVMHRTRPEDYIGECRTIFEACRELFQAGRPIDPTTVRAKVGGAYTQFLLQLMEETPTAANVEEYIKLTVEQAKQLLWDNRESIAFDHIDVCENIAKVSVVGAGMYNNPGVAAAMFEALFNAGINISMISTSEIKVSVLVDMDQADRAVQVIHDQFTEELEGRR